MVQSPLQNHDVALVLNRNSGLVRPQLHVCYEPLITTTKLFYFSSLWKVRAGFAWRAGHTLSRSGMPDKCALLSNNTFQQE